MPETVLIIEDESDVVDLIRYNLKKAKFRVLTAQDGAEGFSMAVTNRPDAVVLDIMLPRLNGFEVLKKLKADSKSESIPILILSAKGEADSRIKGLQLGADDFMPKPFSPKELVLRIQALLRRSTKAVEPEISRTGPFVFDRTAMNLTLDGKRLDLTATEFKLVSMLVANAGSILSREELLQEVWGYSSIVDSRTVDTHMKRLREKLGSHATCMETIRGQGYRFNP
jgi:two-component system, OmpR family, phosphate regulon response regulator PhoB